MEVLGMTLTAFSGKALGWVKYLFVAIAPGLLWPGVVASFWVPFMGQVELLKLLSFEVTTWNHLTVWKLFV